MAVTTFQITDEASTVMDEVEAFITGALAKSMTREDMPFSEKVYADSLRDVLLTVYQGMEAKDAKAVQAGFLGLAALAATAASHHRAFSASVAKGDESWRWKQAG